MKNLFIVASLSILITSCTKNSNNSPTPTPVADATPPVLTLNGSTNDTISLNSTYADPGAAAMDNVDGNISSQIVVTGTINKDLVGEYRLYYNVKDAAGNAAVQLTRYVYVENDADYLVGTYMATPNCGASPTTNGTVTLTTSNTLNNKVSFGILNNVSYISPNIMVSGSAISIPMQNSGSNSIVGNGTIASNKLSFSLTYTAVGNAPTFGTWNCTSNYVKQ